MTKPLYRELPLLEKHGRTYKDCLFDKGTTKLHKEQQEALQEIVNWFGNEDTKDSTAVVVMPTGSGKTGVICCLPYMLGWAATTNVPLIPREVIDLSKPILVIAPGLAILDQLKQNLCYNPNNENPFLMKVGILDSTNITDGSFYNTYTVDNARAIKGLATSKGQYQIVLSNSQKWRKKLGIPNYEKLDSSLFSVVIVDEAHHLPAKQWQEILEKFRPHAKVLFFTATPNRHDGKEITTDLALSKKGLAYNLTREDAIQNGLIREIDFEELSGTPQESYEMVIECVKGILDDKNSVDHLPGGIKHSAIIIARSIDESAVVEDVCLSMGFNRREVKDVTGPMTATELADVIKEIKAGTYRVIIIVKRLLEGFDYPPLSVAGVLTRIQSPVKFAQFVGRIQRLVRHNGVIERSVRGNIITHECYQQEDLYRRYKSPVIPRDEDQHIDE